MEQYTNFIAKLYADGRITDAEVEEAAKTASFFASAFRRDHTKLLICSMPKLVPFLTLREWNIEHRHRQPEAVRI